MAAVSNNNLPAPFPKSAMAGIIKPTMINGMAKFKNCPKNALNVVNIRFNASGKYCPKIRPNTMARKTLNSKFENICFIIYAN